MPIYEYRCGNPKCLRQFEHFTSVEACALPAECPACKELGKRILSKPHIATGAGGRIPGLCTSLPGDPVYVKSKRHFQELCKQRNAGRPVEIERRKSTWTSK